jgi:YidC/Oxa1 family membrane protein insertase
VAEVFGAILRFLGAVLSGVYDLIPSYGLAIIILTILVRIVLIPLTVKQIRSMNAMQRLQPELKRLQQKYKGDRQKLNEEVMKLYREHGVNPLGGCFPLLMQMPVFIALYSVLRAPIGFDAGLPQATPVDFTFTKNTICRTEGTPAPKGIGKTKVICQDGSNQQEFTISSVIQQKSKPQIKLDALPAYVTTCSAVMDTKPNPDEVQGFSCSSPKGTGHLPVKGRLFGDIVRDRATFLGMHLACSPTQATSATTIRQCTAAEHAGAGPALIGYYGLVLLMMGSTYYQQKQMSQQASGPQAKQMQMMGRVMPLFLGFISLNIPTGVVIYWIVSNVWTIGQQQFFLKRQITTPLPPASGPPPGGKGKPSGPPSGGKGKPAKPKQ